MLTEMWKAKTVKIRSERCLPSTLKPCIVKIHYNYFKLSHTQLNFCVVITLCHNLFVEKVLDASLQSLHSKLLWLCKNGTKIS